MPLGIVVCTRAVEEAAANDDLRSEAYLQRGVLHETAGDRDAAIKDYTEAIKLDPQSSVGYFNRGHTFDQGEHDLAIADYTQAIKLLTPSDSDTFNNRGQAYDNKGEIHSAITDYSAAISLNPDNARAFFNRGLRQHTRAYSNVPFPISIRPSGWNPIGSGGPTPVAGWCMRNWAMNPQRWQTIAMLDPLQSSRRQGGAARLGK